MYYKPIYRYDILFVTDYFLDLVINMSLSQRKSTYIKKMNTDTILKGENEIAKPKGKGNNALKVIHFDY